MASPSSQSKKTASITDSTASKEPNVLGLSPPQLLYFCIYNPSLGQTEETQKDQLLYYTAKKIVPVDIKMRQVGLAQALVSFTHVFSPNKPAQTVHSQKNRLVFLQPEPGFWMHMCVELAVNRKYVKDPVTGKHKNTVEYLDSELNDRHLQSLLQNSYRMFKLLNGPFATILTQSSSNPRQAKGRLMNKLEDFFLELAWKWDFDNPDSWLSSVFDGIAYHPISKYTYLQIQNTCEQLHTLVDVKEKLLVLNGSGKLLWHSPELEVRDVRFLTEKIVSIIEVDQTARQLETAKAKAKLADAEKLNSSGWSSPSILSYFSSKPSIGALEQQVEASSRHSEDTISERSPTSTSILPQGYFITGLVRPGRGDVKMSNLKLVKVFLEKEENIERKGGDSETRLQEETEYYILVYKHNANLVFTFLVPAWSPLISEKLVDEKFYEDLEDLLTKHDFVELVKLIEQDEEKMNKLNISLEKEYKYLYFDDLILAIRSSIIGNTKTNKKDPLINDMILSLLDVKDEFARFPHLNEVFTRSTANYWILGRKFSATSGPSSLEYYPELYVISSKKDASLVDVDEDIRKLSSLITAGHSME